MGKMVVNLENFQGRRNSFVTIAKIRNSTQLVVETIGAHLRKLQDLFVAFA